MKNKRIWVFRLSLGNSGAPCGACPVGIDKDDISEYRLKTPPLDEDDYRDIPNLNMDILLDELDKGILRQGWGWTFDNMDLDLRPSQHEWVQNYIKLAWRLWGEKLDCEDAMGRYNILKLMKEMRRGDIIILPKIPDDSRFTVATVKKEYYFQQLNGYLGHGHVIEVKKIKNFEYGSRIRPKVFTPNRKAISEVKNYHKNYKKISDFIKNNYL